MTDPAARRKLAEETARLFHDTYERLAPQYGYQTRKETAVPWEEVPENNKRLMIAVCAEVEAVVRAEALREVVSHIRSYSELLVGSEMFAQIVEALAAAPEETK